MRKYVNDSFVNSVYYCDRVAATAMGQYSTQVEESFIREEELENLQFPFIEMDTR